MLFMTVFKLACTASIVIASKSRMFAALTTKRSINASFDVKRLNSAVSTFSQLDLIILDVIISEFTLRKSAYTASIDIVRSEEHTSELQSRFDLVCRLLLEK